MRRSVLAALLAFVVLAWPAQAQLFPTNPGGTPPPAPSDAAPQTAERVLVDTTLYVNPPKAEGLCVTLDAGQVTVTVKRVQDAIVERRPASFQMSGLMADPDVNINLTIGDTEATASTHVNGAWFYCWSVSINAPETQGMSNAQRGGYVQRIAVKITLAPQ